MNKICIYKVDINSHSEVKANISLKISKTQTKQLFHRLQKKCVTFVFNKFSPSILCVDGRNKAIVNKDENKHPSNIEAEQALLGSILVNNDIIDEISNIVNSAIFYDPAHIKIFDVIQSLNNKGMVANPITLKNF